MMIYNSTSLSKTYFNNTTVLLLIFILLREIFQIIEYVYFERSFFVLLLAGIYIISFLYVLQMVKFGAVMSIGIGILDILSQRMTFSYYYISYFFDLVIIGASISNYKIINMISNKSWPINFNTLFIQSQFSSFFNPN